MVHADPASPLAHAAARQLFVADDSHAQRTLKELAADAGGPAAGLLANNDAEKLLAVCAGNAPYLARLIQREALLLPDLLSQDPAAMRDRLLAGCCEAMRDADDMAALMRAARVAKRRLALLAAVADVAGAWPLEEVTRTLSLLADTVIEQGACWLLRQAAARGEITLADEATPTRGSWSRAAGKSGLFKRCLDSVRARTAGISHHVRRPFQRREFYGLGLGGQGAHEKGCGRSSQ